MPDRIEQPKTPNNGVPTEQHEALLRFLLEKNQPGSGQLFEDRKEARLGLKGDRGDLFLQFSDPFARRDRTGEFFDQVHQLKVLLSRRSQAEESLKPEQKDELRRARRDYAGARSDAERKKYSNEIEKLVPGSADLNLQVREGLQSLGSIDTLQPQPELPGLRMQSTIQCHRPVERLTRYFDPNTDVRKSVTRNFDAFFQPKSTDQFEARWAQLALDSPIVKANEALKQLPPMKVSSDDPVKLIKMGLTIAGVEINSQSAELIEKALGGVKGISKEPGNRFVIDRDGKVEIPLPEKQDVALGIKVRGLEAGRVSFTLGEGKYPEIKDIKGLTVKLDVPDALLGQVSKEVEIKRIFFTRDGGDFKVNVELVNPMTWVARKTAKQFSSKVPDTDTITHEIATLGPDGKPK